MLLPNLNDLGDLSGKKVLVRVDFNVPIINSVVSSDFRLKEAVPTLNFLKEKGASLILVSHFPSSDESYLKEVSQSLSKLVDHTLILDKDLSSLKKKVGSFSNGEVCLFPNLRMWGGEESLDEDFAKEFTSLADFYVNEAFSVAHRKHSSVVLFPKFLPSFAGLRFVEEVENLSKVFSPKSPFLFILGGAKFETKIPLINKFLDKADQIFIGGALANDFFKELGYEVGRSVVSLNRELIGEEIIKNSKILIPKDVTVESSEGAFSVKKPSDVTKDEMIVDIGPETIEFLKDYTDKANLILWNGPMGIYEKGLTEYTESLAKLVAQSGALSIVGGGDTAGSIENLDIRGNFGFVSTGGGAMLEFLVKETLPGIEALRETKNPLS